MPTLTQWETFLIASFLFIQLPGPSLLFTLGRALSVGRRAALTSVVGNALGLMAQIGLVALGLGALVATSATAYTVVKVVGALYVLYLGVQAIRHRADAREALTAGTTPSSGGGLRIGALVGLTNPKTIVFFVAFLPQFSDQDAPAAPQLLALGAAFCLMAACSDGVWALAASRAKDWFATEPKRLDRISGAGGSLMVALGLTMLVRD